MKKLLIGLCFLLVGGLVYYKVANKSYEAPVGGGGYFQFYDSTKASSTVGLYSWVQLATSTPDQGFHRICDVALPGVNNNNPVWLTFTASSTAPIPNPPYGTKLASGDCYTMTRSNDNMFIGFIFGRASTSTTTLLQTFK